MNKYKKYFPIFKNNPNLVYLDLAATSLKPQRVIDKEAEYYQKYSANVGRGMCDMAMKATLEYENTREEVARFIGSNVPNEVVFTHGATEGINLVAEGWGGNNLQPGDEIILTEVEHHANLLPWIKLAKNKGLIIKYVPFDRKVMDLRWEELDRLVTPKTRVLSCTHVSNVTGIANDVQAIVKKIKKKNLGVMVVVDGAQAVGHLKIEVMKMGADYYIFSGHKMYGPTGVGVVWGKMSRWMEAKPLILGGGAVEDSSYDDYQLRDPPHGFEAGTPAIAQVIALREAVAFIGQVGWKEINRIEDGLAQHAFGGLREIDGVTVVGNKDSRIITFTVGGIHPHDVADFMGKRGICVRAGHHCCLPLHKKLKLMATTRLSFGVYNTTEDVDEAIETVVELKNIYAKK